MALRKRIVVVGLGSIGRRHVRILRKNPRVEVEICDQNPEMTAMSKFEAGEMPVHTSFDDALDSRPNYLVIATPHSLHARQSIAALESGVNVLCEKPMSDSLNDARSMVAAAKKSRAILSVGYMNHFRPAVVRLKSLIDFGRLGEVLQFKVHVGSFVTLVNSVSRYQENLPGALLMDYAHQPDLMYWLLRKKPLGVYVAGTRGGDMEHSSDPNILFFVMDYDGPLLSCISLNYLQMPQRDDCEIIGDRGWAFWDVQKESLRIGTREGTSNEDSTVVEEIIPDVRDELYAKEHEHFLDAAEGKCEPESPPEEAIVATEIIDAALRSWQERRRVEL